MKGRAGVQNGDQPSVKRAWKVCVYWGRGRRRGAKGQKTQLNMLTGKLAHTPPTMTEFST